MNSKMLPITPGGTHEGAAPPLLSKLADVQPRLPRSRTTTLSPAQARFVFLEQGVGAAIGNFVLNGLIGWVAYRSVSSVSLWGTRGVVADAIATSFLLPLITCLILRVVVRKKVHSRAIQALPASWRTRAGFALLPRNVALRGLTLGLFSALAVAVPAVGVLVALQVTSLSLTRFLVFKALHAMTLAILTSPVAAVYALASAPSRRD